MSTRANIKFKDQWETYFIDRSHDGFPENILADIKECVDRCEGLWSGSDLGQLVSCFIGMHYEPNSRIQRYEICKSKAGDESFLYFVTWDEISEKYVYGVKS